MNTDTPELLPCPFCDGRPRGDHPMHWTGAQSIIIGGLLRHYCTDGFYMEIRRPTVGLAIDAWNRRAAVAGGGKA